MNPSEESFDKKRDGGLTISTLIKALEEAKALYGDIQIYNNPGINTSAVSWQNRQYIGTDPNNQWSNCIRANDGSFLQV